MKMESIYYPNILIKEQKRIFKKISKNTFMEFDEGGLIYEALRNANVRNRQIDFKKICE